MIKIKAILNFKRKNSNFKYTWAKLKRQS